MLSLLNVARPIAMKALQNPKILGSLLVGTFGSQQANEIQNQLKLGNISLDNIYDTLINFAASPAVSALRDTPSGQESSPDEAQIEAERKFNEELNRRVTLPSQTPIEQLLSTPPTTTVPEPLITPDVPEEKTKVEDVGMTASPDAKLSDLIMTMKGDTNDQDETKSLTTSQSEKGKESITQTLEPSTTQRGSELQQSDQGRETETLSELPLVKASQEQGVTFFSDILGGELYVPKKSYDQLLDTSDAMEATKIFDEKRTGNFENHIFTSIPTFKEAQIATADAIAKTLPKGGTIIDIGGTEGGFVNTIAELNPDIEGIVLDPNPKAEESFLKQKLPNTEFIREAFTTNPEDFGKYAFTEKGVDVDYFDPKDIPDNSVDAFSEKMVFQFIDNQRADKIKLLKSKLKPDGFAIFEEKFFTSKDDPVWQENEQKKNEFKSQYYDPEQITEKEEIVLTGMNERQVPSDLFEKVLKNNFNNVVQYWDSGNFKGYVASDSADTITKFLDNMVDLNSEYSNVVTPNFITKTIDKKRRGGPISLPKIDML